MQNCLHVTDLVPACRKLAAEEVSYLFVQYAESATLADGKLTMGNVAKDVLYFADRPDRIVGRESMDKWMGFWHKGEDSFAKVPPNAVLAVANPQGGVPLDMVVILMNPVYADDTLVYDVEVLDGPESGEGGSCALFIDAVGIPGVGPTSYRGQARRVSRRTARRTSRRMYRRQHYQDDLYGNDNVSNDAYRRGYMDAQDDFFDDDAAASEAYRQGYDDGRKDFY